MELRDVVRYETKISPENIEQKDYRLGFGIYTNLDLVTCVVRLENDTNHWLVYGSIIVKRIRNARIFAQDSSRNEQKK